MSAKQDETVRGEEREEWANKIYSISSHEIDQFISDNSLIKSLGRKTLVIRSIKGMIPSQDNNCPIDQLLHHWGLCQRCIRRLSHGQTSKSSIHFAKSEQTQTESVKSLCPICLGLLHHPHLCDVPDVIEEHSEKDWILVYLYKTITRSNYQFTGIQLNVTEPISIPIREVYLWNELYRIASSGDSSIGFNSTDVDERKASCLSLKTIWKWIVEPKLKNLLSNTFYSSSVNPNLYDTACDLLCVHVEFSSSIVESDFNFFTQTLETTSINSIQSSLHHLCFPKSRTNRHKRFKKPKLDDQPDAGDLILKEKESEADCMTSEFVQLGYIAPQSTRISRTGLVELISQLPHQFAEYGAFKLLAHTTKPNFLTSIKLSRLAPLVIAGRYVKLSRRLPQTPWIVDNQRKLDSSVEELITNPMTNQFGRNCRTTFVSSGREDVDVRCLGLGRPFIIEIDNYETIVPTLCENWSLLSKSNTNSDSVGSIDLLKLASYINSQTRKQVFVRDLQIVHSTSASKTIKSGEMEKAKLYRAICWCPNGGLNSALLEQLATKVPLVRTEPLSDKSSDTLDWPPYNLDRLTFGPMPVDQLTPIRVLHRRTLMNRSRLVNHFSFLPFEQITTSSVPEFEDFLSWSKLYPPKELFILELRCEAGTYVKEFVHGDLGRTRPSLAGLFDRQVDILALDVIAVEFNWPPMLPAPATWAQQN